MNATEAKLILGDEFFIGLRDFYREIRESKHQYKVCLVRRSFVLSRIFMSIDGVSEVNFDENGCMTDSAIFSLCTEIAVFFLTYKKFPDILVCDDILIHGRAMNAFLVKLENQIIDCLKEQGCSLTEDTVRTKLISAIDVRVYMKSDKSSLMLARYQTKVKCNRVAEASVWRNLSNRMSVLICESGDANASFILSARIKETEIDVGEDEYVSVTTSYRENVQTAYIKTICDAASVSAILTIRKCTTPVAGEYRLIPFIFLPSLSQYVKEEILFDIKSRLPNGKFVQIVQQWERSSSRLCSEFLSMVLSQSLLLSFINEYGLVQEDSGQDEIIKLAHNYGRTQDVYELLRYIQWNALFTMKELLNLLRDVTAMSWPICREIGMQHQDEQSENLLYIMENMISEAGWKAEKQAYELRTGRYVPTKLQYKEMRTNIVDFMEEVIKETERINEQFSFYYMTAYILQFMDAGLMAVSVYKEVNSEEEYAQYCKAGEQSITVQPKRNARYIPLLMAMERRCIGAGLNFQKELLTFIENSEKTVDEKKAMLDSINDFMEKLRQTGQSVSDWDFFMIECSNQQAKGDLTQRSRELVRRSREIAFEQKEYIMQYRAGKQK